MFGYKMENGNAIIQEQEAEMIRQIFQNYLSGMSLKNSAIAAGMPMAHSRVKNILHQKCYISDDFYPAIVDEQIFEKANAELIRRAEKHFSGKLRKEPPIFQKFTLSVPAVQFEDPIKQAEYLYSLIEVIA